MNNWFQLFDHVERVTREKVKWNYFEIYRQEIAKKWTVVKDII